MIDTKQYVKELLKNSQPLLEKLGKYGKIYASYPNEITVFPCVIYTEENQYDDCFYDNYAEGSAVKVRIHVFTKTNSGYPSTWEIGNVIHSVFRKDMWSCVYNSEMSDVDDNVRHRVMDFTKGFYSPSEI